MICNENMLSGCVDYICEFYREAFSIVRYPSTIKQILCI